MTMPIYASPEQFMRDRSEYARKGIARGRSVVVTTYSGGVLFVAENHSPTLHKVSEIYDRIGPPGALLQFFGPARGYETISYYQALEPEKFLPRDALRGKTVLVGLSLQNAPSVDRRGADSFATPFSLATGRLTSGVEVQATILDNLAHRLFIRPAPLLCHLGAILAAALFAGLLTRRPLSWRSVIAAAAAGAAIAIASFLALQHGRVWLSPALPLLAGAVVMGVQGGRDFIAERRQRRAITRAFAHYLAPELVERLAQDPSLLKLGGDRRRLSILFCDIRGFTGLAERLKDDPERLTSLINRLLDPLSEAVLAHRGTIDKYIGDCIMAFWNAPLDDDQHERHAISCALAMLEGLAGLNRALAEDARPGEEPLAFSVGIGVDSGDCVVGNLGSNRRFDYSALGDAVNLASRLEGISKRYGVPLVVGAETARAVAGAFVMIELDLIAVKGRQDAAPIFTVLSPGDKATDERLLACHAAMLEAYRGQRWDEAMRHLEACRPMAPGLAGYHEAMTGFIAHLRAAPPGPGWQGIYQAETK